MRPKIADIAKAAGVSVASVNRFLSRPTSVKASAAAKISDALDSAGYPVGRSTSGKHIGTVRLAFLLPLGTGPYGLPLSYAIRQRAELSHRDTEVIVEHFGAHDCLAKLVLELAATFHAICICSGVDALLSDAFAHAQDKGVGIFAIGSPQAENIRYFGIDHWKVGRTAAWLFENLCRKAGPIGAILGAYRCLDHEMQEAGLRSYFRESDKSFNLMEPWLTGTNAQLTEEAADHLLSPDMNLAGIYASGGAVPALLRAHRRQDGRRDIVVLTSDAFEEARPALIDGVITASLSPPLDQIAVEALSLMEAHALGLDTAAPRVTVRPILYTLENI